MKKKVILGSSERYVCELLWQRSPQTMTELLRSLEQNPGWSKSTVNTMLARMTEKGLITYEQGEKAKLYKPCIKKRDADLAETESLIDRVYDGSVSMMMSTLMRQKKLKDEDVAELRRLLDEM